MSPDLPAPAAKKGRTQTFVKLPDGSQVGFFSRKALRHFVLGQAALAGDYLPQNRKARLGRLSGHKSGPFSRGWFLDAYGERLKNESPEEMLFARYYVHPCKGVSAYDGSR